MYLSTAEESDFTADELSLLRFGFFLRGQIRFLAKKHTKQQVVDQENFHQQQISPGCRHLAKTLSSALLAGLYLSGETRHCWLFRNTQLSQDYHSHNWSSQPIGWLDFIVPTFRGCHQIVFHPSSVQHQVWLQQMITTLMHCWPTFLILHKFLWTADKEEIVASKGITTLLQRCTKSEKS